MEKLYTVKEASEIHKYRKVVDGARQLLQDS